MSSGALDDIRIVDLSHGIAGAYCSKVLADLGAEVIKVEPPAGDGTRRLGPFPGDLPHPEKSGLFQFLNTNKLGITLAIDMPSGQKALDRLLCEADVLVEDYPPQTARCLGLTCARLHALNSQLVITSITPFGQSGPYQDLPGTDLTVIQMSGMGNGTPPRVKDPMHQPPLRPGPRQSEFLAGVSGAAATMHGLYLRETLGRGVQLDVSQHESMASLMFNNLSSYAYTGVVPKRTDGADSADSPVLPCRDGLVCLMAGNPHHWHSWLRVVGIEEGTAREMAEKGLSRAGQWELLGPRIREWMMARTRAEITEVAQAAHVPIEPVFTVGEAAQSRQLAARGFFVEVERDGQKFTFPGAPYRFAEISMDLRRPAPKLGEHNVAILSERLGYSRLELAKLAEAGVI